MLSKKTVLAVGVVAASGVAMVAMPSSASAWTIPSYQPTAANTAAGPFPQAQLAAGWWQWALETPADNNPLLDPTGANCRVGQNRLSSTLLPRRRPVRRSRRA